VTAAEAERGLAVVVPAPWEALSGGSTFDRRLVTALRAGGARVRVEVVRGAWPRPSPVERAALAEALVHPDGADVVVDGLLAAAAPAEVRAAVDDGVRVHALVHLPLALETGLDPAVAAELDRCEAASLRAATSVLATSSWAADELRHRHGLVDVGVARPGTEPAPVARGSRHRVPQLLQLASVRPVKDQLGVVAALGRLRDLRWTAVLAGPVGDAGYAAAVDAAVGAAGLRGRVRLAGPVVGDELERLWDATDLLLLPSRAETWGMVVTESLARGIPAVVSAGTGAVEALGGARAGALPGAVVAPADPEQLSTAVRRLLGPTGAAARAAAGVARRQLARGGGWDSTAGAVLDHLRAGRRPDRRPTDDRPMTERGTDP